MVLGIHPSNNDNLLEEKRVKTPKNARTIQKHSMHARGMVKRGAYLGRGETLEHAEGEET